MQQSTDLLRESEGAQLELPNATAVLVLGILSILGGLCYGLGIICSIIGLVLANKDKRLYQAAPELYSVASASRLGAGRICSIIGLVLSVIFIILILLVLIFWRDILAANPALKH